MSSQPPSTKLDPNIRRLLSGLRWRIRLYVWMEGLLVALLWLGMTFWASLAIDYLPVLVGASELPLMTRAILLAVISIVLAFILYRWILQRIFVQLADRSMAVLLERSYENFQDRLVTAVEMRDHPDHAEEFNQAMLAQTGDEARKHVDHVKLHRIFNKAALLKRFLLAAGLILPVGVLAAFDSNWTYQPGSNYESALTLAIERLYLLDNKPWPRKADIQVVGVELLRNNSTNANRVEFETTLRFDKNRRLKVGRGANLKLLIHADRSKTIPKECVIHYRTRDGVNGRRKMIKQGSTSGDYQLFVFDDKPLKGILVSLEFDVIGFDARVRNYHIDVVENPTITETSLDYQFPRYIDKLPVTGETWIKGKSLPLGSQLAVHFKSNKKLRQVHLFNLLQAEEETPDAPAQQTSGQHDHSVIHLAQLTNSKQETPIPVAITTAGTLLNPETNRPQQVAIASLPTVRDPDSKKTLAFTLVEKQLAMHLPGQDPQVAKTPTPLEVQDINTQQWIPASLVQQTGKPNQFDFQTESLHRNLALDIFLVDTDGIVTERPHRVSLAANRDTAPALEVAVKGIGSAVTPDVVIPVQGEVKDDYGVADNWFQVQTGELDPQRFDFKLQSEQKIDDRLDFREIRSQEGGLELTPGQRLVLTLNASDHYDLEGDPNVGASSPFSLDIVTPDQLLSLLERRELATRQRYELIIEEVTEMKDSLQRVAEEAQGLTDQATGSEPEDKQPETPGPADEAGGNEDKKLTPEEKKKRSESLRLLRVQRALLQSQKSAQEILGVATSFDDIREELINNRVDTADRKSRLQDQIAKPLFLIANESFPKLDELLEKLQPLVGQAEQEPQLALDALTQTVDILQQMDEVLQKMLELETYNELIDLVRSLIKEQEEIQEKTKQERKKQLLDLLK